MPDFQNNGGLYLPVAKRVTPSDVHVNRPLTNISVAYMQSAANYVSTRIFPSVPVQKQTDLYWIYDRSFLNRNEVRPRAPSSETLGMALRYSTSPYRCEVYGLHIDIDDRTMANADVPLTPMSDATTALTHQAMQFKELAWVSRYFTPGVWNLQESGIAAAPVVGTSVLQWNDAASTPAKDVRRWRTKVRLASGGFAPNKMVLSRSVYDMLLENPSIIDSIKYSSYTGPVQVTKTALEQLFEVDEILILDAIVNTANEGQPEVNTAIGGKHVALYYVPPSAGLQTPSAGYTFEWNSYQGGTLSQQMSSWFMQEIKSTRVEIELGFDMAIIGQDLALFCQNVIA
jgi:hypothetical protein